MYPFRMEPPRIGRYKEYSPGVCQRCRVVLYGYYFITQPMSYYYE